VAATGNGIFMVDNLELVDKFCCMSDILGKGGGGGAEEASRTRVRCAGENSMSLHQFCP